MRDAPRFEIELRDEITGRQKRVDMAILVEEYDAAMASDDPELFMKAYVLKRLCQTTRLGNFRPVPNGVHRVLVN